MLRNGQHGCAHPAAEGQRAPVTEWTVIRNAVAERGQANPGDLAQFVERGGEALGQPFEFAVGAAF